MDETAELQPLYRYSRDWRNRRPGDPVAAPLTDAELFELQERVVEQRLRRWKRDLMRTRATGGTPPAPVPAVTARTRSRERRDASGRSSARSGDSGDSSDSSEPPPDGRLCKCGCGLALTGLRRGALYLNDVHRKRGQRKRERVSTDRVVAPDLRPLGKYRVQPWELHELRSRPGCRCNGHHIAVPDEYGVHCAKCGHWRDILAAAA